MRSLTPLLSALILALVLSSGPLVLSTHGQDANALYPMQKKSDWGFVNAQGEWTIEPQFPNVGAFHEGLAIARVPGENKWGFLNPEGKWAIPPRFGQKYAMHKVYGGRNWYDAPLDPFHDGLAPALVDSVLGVINTKGNIVKRFPSYSLLRPFHQGRAVFATDEKKGYINTEWEVVIDPAYEEAGNFHNGLAVVQKSFGAAYGYIDKTAKYEIDAQFEEAGDFSNGLAPAKTGAFKPYGYIDTDGQWAIEPQFEDAQSFSEGLAFVQTEKKNFYIDEKGTRTITSPISGFKLCHGSPFNQGLALVSVVKASDECGQPIQVGMFEKPANSAFAYINTSGDIVYRQSLKNGRYLKRIQDSIDAAERREEKRRKKAEAREERRELAKCADVKAYGDTTAESYVEIGYRGVTRRYHYTNDVFQKKGSDTFRYHIPAFQNGSGNTFLELQPLTLEPSFIDESKLEVQDLGYRFSLSGRALRENPCIKFPSDATDDGSVMNVTTKGKSGLWASGQVKFTNPSNSKNYILINVNPSTYKTPADRSDSGRSAGGFIINDDDERIPITSQGDVEFKHFPRQKKLEIRARATEQLEGEGAGQSIYHSSPEIENFDGSTGKYVNEPTPGFDGRSVDYFEVLSYSERDVRIRHYEKSLSEGAEEPSEEDLSFSVEYLAGTYEGSGIVTAVDLKPVVYSLSN